MALAHRTILRAVLVVASLALARPARAGELRDQASRKEEDDDRDVAVGGEADLNARQLWRGLAMSRGPVVEPSAWAEAYGLRASLWASVLLEADGTRRLSAIVPEVTWALAWRAITITPSFLYYDTPGHPIPPHTAEASLEAAIDLGAVRLATRDYVDVRGTPGAHYGTIGARVEPKAGRWSFRGEADVGWGTAAFNRVHHDAHVAAVDVAEAGVGVQRALGDVLYVALHAEGSTLVALRRTARESTLGNVGVSFGGELGL